jgi:hypothetical protein
LNHLSFGIGKTKRASPVNHVPFRINCPLQKKPSISSSVEFEVVESNIIRKIHRVLTPSHPALSVAKAGRNHLNE